MRGCFRRSPRLAAADEVQDRYNILIGMPTAQPAVASQLSTAQTVPSVPRTAAQ